MSLEQLETRSKDSTRRFLKQGMAEIEKTIAKQRSLSVRFSKQRQQLANKLARKLKRKDIQSDPELKLLEEMSGEMNEWAERYKRVLDAFEKFKDERSSIIDQLLALCHRQYRKLCQSNTYNSMFIYKRDSIVQKAQRDKLFL